MNLDRTSSGRRRGLDGVRFTPRGTVRETVANQQAEVGPPRGIHGRALASIHPLSAKLARIHGGIYGLAQRPRKGSTARTPL